jgi:hypothetical protein
MEVLPEDEIISLQIIDTDTERNEEEEYTVYYVQVSSRGKVH